MRQLQKSAFFFAVPFSNIIYAMKNNTLIRSENLVSNIILFCLPIMLGTLLQQLYNAVDVMVIGNTLGSIGIAAVGGSSGMIIIMMTGLFTGLSSGITVVISRHTGEGDDEKVRAAVETSILFSIAGGILFTIIGIAFTPLFLRLMDTPEEIMKDSVTYLRFYFAGITGVFVYNSASAVIRARGDSSTPLFILAICTVINIVLDIILVVAFKTGVAGVALATAVSQGISAVLSVVFIFRKGKGLGSGFIRMKFSPDEFGEMIRIGLPGALQSVMNSVSGIVMTVAVNTLGTFAVAGNTAYAKLDGIFWMVSTAFGVTASTFAAYYWGKRDTVKVKKVFASCLWLDAAMSVCISIFFFTASPLLLRLFTRDSGVISSGMEVMKAIAPYYALVSLFEITGAVLRGMGNVIIPMAVNILFLCFGRIFWIEAFLPLTGKNSLYDVILSCPATWLCTALFMVPYYLASSSRLFRKLEKQKEKA